MNVIKMMSLLLLDKGLDCLIFFINHLENRFYLGSFKNCKLLIDRGADYSILDYCLVSIVVKTCEDRHTEIVMMLLDRGANYSICYDRDNCQEFRHVNVFTKKWLICCKIEK